MTELNERVEAARRLFQEGFNCAQAVVGAFTLRRRGKASWPSSWPRVSAEGCVGAKFVERSVVRLWCLV